MLTHATAHGSCADTVGGCTSGEVYVPCIYGHDRCELVWPSGKALGW